MSDRKAKNPPAADPDETARTPSPVREISPDGQQDRASIPEVLPILPIRQTVVFPGSVAPLVVRRGASLKLLDESLPQNRIIAVATQRDPEIENPTEKDLYPVGSAVVVLRLARQPEDAVTLLLHGLRRLHIGDVVQREPYLRANVKPIEDVVHPSDALSAAFKHLRETAGELVRQSPAIPDEVGTVIESVNEPGQLADFLTANLDLDTQPRQELLEELDVARRIGRVQHLVSRQLDIARIQHKIHQDVQSSISETQRKAYLREQMRAIQRELGEEDPATQQTAELRRAIEEADPPENVVKEAGRELRRLEVIPAASPEYSVILTYLEAIAELPWNKLSEDLLDLDRARGILDHDHHDLEKVKRRLLEYLAVRKLNPQNRGPILCLVGPPGVGKTSLGQSVADALGRKFVRFSLGGIRDEAEIRGHRRTYIGAMPGRILQEIRRAGTRNPVMMLDEIDKIGADFRGDPASALLEVLDPRQNDGFLDRYLDVPFDLSQVLFIATANYMGPVPGALRDRMEVIEIPGYTDGEKLQIARRYLVRRQMRENGLKTRHARINQSALRKIIDAYTREAGVRELERQIGAVCRGIAARVARREPKKPIRVGSEEVAELLGPEKYVREVARRVATPGVVTGLAYTPVGGEVLFVEAASYPGKGHLHLTGQIGDVMKESATAALSLIRSRADSLGIAAETFTENDLHLHVPAGAVPKDGPSAGVAMYTAIASLLTHRPARPDVAMTGEVTLRGLVMPIGGVKEKTLAAQRAGIKTVILPKQNEKDMPDVPEEAAKKLNFIFAEDVDDLFQAALKPVPTRKRTAKTREKTATTRK